MNPWDLIAMQPMINTLIVLSHYLLSNFGLAIIALTIIVNVCLMPLTLKQIRASKKMQDLQPKLAELRKKYGKDKQRISQEQIRLYKESGMSPTGCIVPMLVQIPIWIALYQSVIRLLAITPEDFLRLSQYLYTWPIVHSTLPVVSKFLWLNLAVPDRTFILAILVGGTMWIQQKMAMPPTTDPNQQAQAQPQQAQPDPAGQPAAPPPFDMAQLRTMVSSEVQQGIQTLTQQQQSNQAAVDENNWMEAQMDEMGFTGEEHANTRSVDLRPRIEARIFAARRSNAIAGDPQHDQKMSRAFTRAEIKAAATDLAPTLANEIAASREQLSDIQDANPQASLGTGPGGRPGKRREDMNDAELQQLAKDRIEARTGMRPK